jgi:hypothetical protein
LDAQLGQRACGLQPGGGVSQSDMAIEQALIADAALQIERT